MLPTSPDMTPAFNLSETDHSRKRSSGPSWFPSLFREERHTNNWINTIYDIMSLMCAHNVKGGWQ
jgi:hypothetical protein